MNSSAITASVRLAASLAAGARLELYLTPKPGLVDLADNGSHPDLSFSLMERSLLLIEGYLELLLRSLQAGEPFREQVAIGKMTEERMLRELGTNTHKGYLFLSGLLLVAAWQAPAPDDRSVRNRIISLAELFFENSRPLATNGGQARGRFRSGGIVAEALAGLPALFDAALPAHTDALRRHGCVTKAAFAMLGRLMQTVEDTTSLHRGGEAGLARIRKDGRELEQIIAAEGDCIPFLEGLNREYIRRNLSMGGVADLLGLAHGWLIYRGQITAEALPEQVQPATESTRGTTNEAFTSAVGALDHTDRHAGHGPDQGRLSRLRVERRFALQRSGGNPEDRPG
jgi:triphosphoribosyl-dephospho-CoA synthase